MDIVTVLIIIVAILLALVLLKALRLPDMTPKGWLEDPPPPDPPVLEVFDSENPVVAELLDADGNTIRQWLQRPPFGFQL